MTIDDFRGDYKWLSNFERHDIRYQNLTYNSVEHAYQAAKTDVFAERWTIKDAPTPRRARELGQTVTMRPDFENRKDAVMLLLLRRKFRIPYLRERLLNTGDAELIEKNTWGDVHWGVCKGQGKNMLGKLLMQVRDEIRQEISNESND